MRRGIAVTSYVLFASVSVIVLTAAGLSDQASSLVAVRVKTDQPGAEVSLDGEHVGLTPLTLKPLPAGRYTLAFVKAGYEDHVEILDIRNGKPSSVFVVLKERSVPLPPLPALYKTVHIHDEGSCDGDMSVHADRLRFVAHASGGHTITVPFADIRMAIRRHAAAYRHTMQTLRGAPTVTVGKGGSAAVAPLYIEAKDGASAFLVMGGNTTEPDAAGTRSLYELVSRLWADATKRRE